MKAVIFLLWVRQNFVFERIELSGFCISIMGSLYSQNRISSFHINVKNIFHHSYNFSLTIPNCTNTVSTSSRRSLHSFRELPTPWMHIISHLKKMPIKSKFYLFSKMFATNHDWLVLYMTSTRTVIKVMLALIFTEVKSLWCITPSTPTMTKFAHEINPN